MSYQFDVNNSLTSNRGPQMLYLLKELAKANGWAVTRSSDGTTAGSGDNISSGAEMAAAWAWYVLQGPNGREILFSKSGTTDARYVYVAYSPSAGFTGGTTASDPTATDGVDVIGTSGAGLSVMPTVDQYCHLCVDTASDSLYVVVTDQATAARAILVILMDELAAGVTGDTDQEVIAIAGLGTSTEVLQLPYFFDENNTQYHGPQAIMDTTGTPTLVRVMPLRLMADSRAMFPSDGTNGAGVNNDDGKDAVMPMIYGRPNTLAAPSGYKGVSSMLKLVGTARAGGDTLSLDSSLDHVVFGTYRVAFPWDGSSTPLGV